MLIDSHCHLDRLKLDKYGGDLSAALSAAADRGVGAMLCVGISLENRNVVTAIARQFANVVCSIGVHPLDIESGIATEQQLVEWSAESKVVALGETGLDYYYSDATRETQQESFRTHLQAGAKAKLPVIVHTRDAKEDTLSLIERYADPNCSGVLHCFTEDWDMARRAIELNFYISISGIVTFKNAEQLRDVTRKLPLDRLLVETDSPYLAPIPYRGKPNEPCYVREVAEFVAELRGVSYQEIIETTAENFFRLFTRARSYIPAAT